MAEPTNLLFICSDEHQRAITGCYGNPIVKTPNIDKLARNGTRFANAYCNAPLCVPSRASFNTGRYAHTLHSYCNASAYTGEHAQSWGHRLSEQGHHVTTIGKLHFAGEQFPTGFPDQHIPMHLQNGKGNVHGLLRERMPPTPGARQEILDAGEGESDYLKYDLAIEQQAVNWLRNEATTHIRPWVLYTGFMYPHYPLVAPPGYCRMYAPETVPLPTCYREEEWPRHPGLDLFRRVRCHDKPFDEATLRKAIATYYAMVSFLDDRIGSLLRVLKETGLAENTRIVYTTDHGEHLGNHGLWWKRAMYDSATAVPLILSGPDIPEGRVVTTNVSLVDLFPTIVSAVGAQLDQQDHDLPGRSLFDVMDDEAHNGAVDRIVFSEYHGAGSAGANYMIRSPRFKYVNYCDGPAQLFDMLNDPEERNDLVGDSRFVAVLREHHAELERICDPWALDQQAKADQRTLLERAGGESKVLQGKVTIYSPPPRTSL